MKNLNLTLCSMVALSSAAWADPSPARTFRQANSACEVQTQGGEYPTYTILKKGVKIYDIDTEVSEVLFSPSGRQIAFGASGISPFADKYEILVYDCDAEAAKYYVRAQVTASNSFTAGEPLSWSADENSIKYLQSYEDDSSQKTLKLNVTSWNQAINIAANAIAKNKLTNVKPECLMFLQNDETAGAYDVEVRENHTSASCGNVDPNSMPRVMGIRIMKHTGLIYSDVGADGSLLEGFNRRISN